jgi:septum formation protein
VAWRAEHDGSESRVNDQQQRSLVLASASPRRRDILSQLGVRFVVQPSDIDERQLPGEKAEAHVLRLAHEKARKVVSARSSDPECPWVLAADTVVVIDGEVFGKPEDDAHAVRMLAHLAGRRHRVLTALALHEVGSAPTDSQLFTTEVSFAAFDEAVARAYVASGEARDKAGSYAIQGLGAGLVREIHGSYTNVVGMPAAETLDLLLHAGVLRSWP